MTWLRIVAGAFVALVLLIIAAGAIENAANYHGGYKYLLQAWGEAVATCLVVVALAALFFGALIYAIQGHLW